jgi:hypothetical protein
MLKRALAILLILSWTALAGSSPANDFNLPTTVSASQTGVSLTWYADSHDPNDLFDFPAVSISHTDHLALLDAAWPPDPWAERKLAKLHKLHCIFLI